MSRNSFNDSNYWGCGDDEDADLTNVEVVKVNVPTVHDYFKGSACISRLEYLETMYSYGRTALCVKGMEDRESEYALVERALKAIRECPADSVCGARLVAIWGQVESDLESNAKMSLLMMERGSVLTGEHTHIMKCFEGGTFTWFSKAISDTNTIYWG